MKKNGLLHSELMKAITAARHHDTIIICDVGMPVPDGCNYIDLALVRGLPSLPQVLKAVLNEMVIERYEIFDLMPQYNPEMYARLQAMMPNVMVTAMSRHQFSLSVTARQQLASLINLK